MEQSHGKPAANQVDSASKNEGSEGQWRWADGRNMTWTNWFKRQNQPDNKAGVEHFGLMSNQKLVEGFIGWEWSNQPNEAQAQHQPRYIREWDRLTLNESPHDHSRPDGAFHENHASFTVHALHFRQHGLGGRADGFRLHFQQIVVEIDHRRNETV